MGWDGMVWHGMAWHGMGLRFSRLCPKCFSFEFAVLFIHVHTMIRWADFNRRCDLVI